MKTEKKEKTLKVLVCYHKKDYLIEDKSFLPIQVGKSSSNVDLNITGDNTGDNISDKNYCYCELTGIYWAWKNLKNVDYIGLCHYRRFFDFHNQCRKGFPLTAFPVNTISEMDLSIPKSLLSQLDKGYVVMIKPFTFGHTLHLDYCANLISEDFHTLRLTINETQPQYIKEAFHETMYHNNKFSPYNMFIMKWSDFDQYCHWLFSLLSLVEKKKNISHYSPAQIRIYGYMGEYLLNVWVKAMNKKRLYKPVIWFNDTGDFWQGSLLKYRIRCLFNDIAVWFAKDRSRIFRLKK